jgi:hypothetical protein
LRPLASTAFSSASISALNDARSRAWAGLPLMKNDGVPLTPNFCSVLPLCCSQFWHSGPSRSALNLVVSRPRVPAVATTPSTVALSRAAPPWGLGKIESHSAFCISAALPCLPAAHIARPDGAAGAPWISMYLGTMRTSFG